MVDEADTQSGKPPNGKRRLLLMAAPVLLLLAGAGGAWKLGLLPRGGHGHTPASAAATPSPATPTFAEMPDIIANLNVPIRQQAFVKLKVELELAHHDDLAVVTARMPRLMDLFTTYLRDMRPDELRSSAGSYRLREALLARANIALAPTEVTDVLFVQMIVQ